MCNELSEMQINPARNFKSAELCDTKSFYQLIVSIFNKKKIRETFKVKGWNKGVKV